MIKRYFAIALAAVVLSVAGASARANNLDDAIESIVEEAESDRFQLWNSCRPVTLSVQGIAKDKDAAKIGLKQETVVIAARSKLRIARLYADRAIAALIVDVTVVGAAFHIGVDYWKPVKDVASGLQRRAGTWGAYQVGTHGDNASFIISSVSELIDRFIDSYLGTNDSVCMK